MTRIIVRAHHDRWGVYEDPEGPPIAEYDTRELAELSARDRGDEVVVEAGEPREPTTDVDTRPAGDGRRDRRVGEERPREEQAGL